MQTFKYVKLGVEANPSMNCMIKFPRHLILLAQSQVSVLTFLCKNVPLIATSMFDNIYKKCTDCGCDLLQNLDEETQVS